MRLRIYVMTHKNLSPQRMICTGRFMSGVREAGILATPEMTRGKIFLR